MYHSARLHGSRGLHGLTKPRPGTEPGTEPPLEAPVDRRGDRDHRAEGEAEEAPWELRGNSMGTPVLAWEKAGKMVNLAKCSKDGEFLCDLSDLWCFFELIYGVFNRI